MRKGECAKLGGVDSCPRAGVGADPELSLLTLIIMATQGGAKANKRAPYLHVEEVEERALGPVFPLLSADGRGPP